jgi:DNA-binding transcriptional ArsR family regulator
VLQACVDAEPSTTKLARTVGISISSASEHAAVLRSAGLLESERQGNTVVHRTTPVGQALIQSTRSRIPMIAG